MTIDVTAPNHAAAGTGGTISINEDTPRTLNASDFGFTDVNDSPADSLARRR